MILMAWGTLMGSGGGVGMVKMSKNTPKCLIYRLYYPKRGYFSIKMGVFTLFLGSGGSGGV